jgi:hypothetical protein
MKDTGMIFLRNKAGIGSWYSFAWRQRQIDHYLFCRLPVQCPALYLYNSMLVDGVLLLCGARFYFFFLFCKTEGQYFLANELKKIHIGIFFQAMVVHCADRIYIIIIRIGHDERGKREEEKGYGNEWFDGMRGWYSNVERISNTGQGMSNAEGNSL